jgi:hypothetical protein
MRSSRLQSLRALALVLCVLSALSALAACSSSDSTLDNGTFTAPASVTVGQVFQATYVATTPSVYPDIKVLPVSTDYIGYADAGPGFVAKLPGPYPALYAISGDQVLGYAMIEITPK